MRKTEAARSSSSEGSRSSPGRAFASTPTTFRWDARLQRSARRPAPSRSCCQSEAPSRRALMRAPHLEAFGEIGGQRESGIQLAEQAALLQRSHHKARADLVVSPHPARRPPEYQVETSSEHVEVAEG